MTTGRVAGRYRLVEQLGAGGMGRVWLARDEMLGRDVAVKEVVPPVGLSEAELIELRFRTLREARTAAQLNHPNVVQIYDVVQTEEWPWIVMEYVPSRSLHEVITRDGPLAPERAAEIGLAVLDALTAAHRAGVLHRDVKPGNVLMASDGRVVLTDFGLATFDGDQGSVTVPGLVLGSAQYVAPERARDGTSSVQADLWSLGATLFAAVEGRSPYARSSTLATLTALATALPDPPHRAGPLKPVLTGLLRRDPRSRLDAAQARRLLHRAADPPPGKVRRGIPRQRRQDPEPATVVIPLSAEPGRDRTVVLASNSGAQTRTLYRPGRRRWPIVLAATATALIVSGGAIAAARTLTPEHPHAGTVSATPDTPQAGSASASASARPAGWVLADDPVLGTSPCMAPAGPVPVTSASAPPSAPANQVPAGWVWYQDAAGFQIAVPSGWTATSSAAGVCFREPGGDRVLNVQTWAANQDPAAYWRGREAALKSTPGYQRIAITTVDYFQAAADWEYQYQDKLGAQLHGAARDVEIRPGHGFIIVWCTSEFDWSVNQDYARLIMASFRPVG
jgi:serine/threonine protein kinase